MLAALAALPLPACTRRLIRITSDPSGARVWLNDTEVGTTPLETQFVFHGRYDVRLEADGYEPFHTGAKAKAPVWEYPGIDLAAELTPWWFENQIDWHFTMVPALEATLPEDQLEQGLLARATTLKAQVEAEAQAAGQLPPQPTPLPTAPPPTSRQP